MAVSPDLFTPRVFHPRWPERDQIDLTRVAFTYWEDVDTLYVDFYGRALPAVSVPVDFGDIPEGIYLRVDAVTEEVYGLQMEGFLRETAQRYPSLLDGLDWAELWGRAREEIARDYPERVATTRTLEAVTAFLDQVEALVDLADHA